MSDACSLLHNHGHPPEAGNRNAHICISEYKGKCTGGGNYLGIICSAHGNTKENLPEAGGFKDFGGSGMRSAKIEHDDTPPGIGSVQGSP